VNVARQGMAEEAVQDLAVAVVHVSVSVGDRCNLCAAQVLRLDADQMACGQPS
jgi:hypothetical protein